MKKFLCVLLTAALIISASLFYFAHAATLSLTTPDIFDGMIYNIRNENSYKYLTVKDGNANAGAQIVQYSATNGKEQQFRLEYTNSGYYHIIPMVNETLRVEIVNASNSNNASVKTYIQNDAYFQAQQFKFIPAGNGSYTIMPRLSTDKVLDVLSGSTADNAIVQLYTSTGVECQKWAMLMVGSFYDVGLEEGSNDSFSEAETISISEMMYEPTRTTGFISSETDVDYYKIVAPRHGMLKIELLPAIDIDYDLKVYDSSQALIGFSDASLDYNEQVEVFTVRNQTLDTYYIKIRGFSEYSTSVPYFIVISYQDYLANLNWSYPLSTSVSSNKIVNSPVGYRSYDGTYHVGIDLDADEGQTVKSICSGSVVGSSFDATAGNYVVILSDDVDPVTGKKIRIRYQHLKSKSVTNGDVVAKNATIGISGNTGSSGGPHLHIDANNGEYENSTEMRGDKTSIINLADVFSDYINFSTGKPYLNT